MSAAAQSRILTAAFKTIYGLGEDEIGYQDIQVLTQNGIEMSWSVSGTVLKAELAEPMLPGSTTTFELAWKAQVPKQIRRSGRDNKEASILP